MRKKLLQQIFSHFQQMTQWVTTSPGNYTEHHYKAESLIEFLEVEDCGSVGGFDKRNPIIHTTSYRLFDRFLTLLRKEKTELEPICDFTVESMTEYFTKVSKLRSETIH